MSFEPTDRDIKAVRDSVHDWVGIDLTETQARELILDPRVASDYVRGGMDTVTRETAADVLAKRIVGRSWPTYGDGGEVGKRFFAEFAVKAEEKGYVVLK